MADKSLENRTEDVDIIEPKIKLIIKKCTPGKARLTVFGELGKDYDAEILINSKGRYMFTCICGATSMGEANAVDLGNRYLRCSNYGLCNFRIPGTHLLDEGPRIYVIKINRDE